MTLYTFMRKAAPFDKASLLLSPIETKRREQMKIYNNINPETSRL